MFIPIFPSCKKKFRRIYHFPRFLPGDFQDEVEKNRRKTINLNSERNDYEVVWGVGVLGFCPSPNGKMVALNVKLQNEKKSIIIIGDEGKILAHIDRE